MPAHPLPADPDIEQLRRRARELQRAVRAGEPDALAEVAERYDDASLSNGDRESFPLTRAQLIVARRYGFTSWAKLKDHVEVVNAHTRRPGDVPEREDPAEEFLRLACLSYESDEPAARGRARVLLDADPAIATATIYTAACVASPVLVQRFLEVDRRLATSEGGPYDWTALCYLAYARHDPDVAADDVRTTARLLLDAGADPNAGYLWHGLPTPFTALTGAFGEGELGPENQPRHPQSLALARTLLEAGAEPNDGQTLYNRQFRPDDDHLVLLYEFGLGQGDGGPWKRRMGDALETPAQMLSHQLWWAITHDFVDRVRLLVANGVDVDTPDRDHRSPIEMATMSGNAEIVELLLEHGASRPSLDAVDELLAAAVAGDRAAVERLRADRPELAADARRRRPGAIVTAASAGRADAVTLLLDLGFDVDALGRSDAPLDGEWETALHAAVMNDDEALVRQLLASGADPTVRDHRFDSTALGWAQHFDHADLIELLTPLTPSP